ncbi:MAG: PIN domain-containing protein [Aquificales bacterium]|nr:PIN domain-containing protein [Aquificales bacterium]
MSVLVDTSVWSLALRRHQPINDPAVSELRRLIQADQVQMIGPIRQELLSGIREKAQFEKLQKHMRAFPDLPLSTADYENAAGFFNISRSHGIQGSYTDFLICAAAVNNNLPILTTDKDFQLFQTHLPITLQQWT